MGGAVTNTGSLFEEPGSPSVVYPAVSEPPWRQRNDGERWSKTSAEDCLQGKCGRRRGGGGQRRASDNAPRLSAHGEEEEAVSGDARAARLRPRSGQRVS